MPVKRASAGDRSSRLQPNQPQEHVQHRDNIPRFVDAEGKRKYELEIKERTMHQEKGFILKDVKHLGSLLSFPLLLKFTGGRSLLPILKILLSPWSENFIPIFLQVLKRFPWSEG